MIDPLSLNLTISTSADRVPSGPPRRLLIPSPQHPDDYILEVDYSSISSFLECPRMGENVLIHARQSRGDETPLNFGRLFHSCEELRLEHGSSPEVFARQREVVAKHFVDHPVQPTEYRNASRMLDVLSRYNQLYALDGWPEKVHIHEGAKFVERPYKVELCTIPVENFLPYKKSQLVVNGKDEPGLTGPRQNLYVNDIHIILTGRIDAILSDSNALFVVDHKTSSRGGAEYERAFNLSLQTRGYCWAARELGIPVVGLIMNGVIARPPTKTGTGTEFIRRTYLYSQDLLDEYSENMKQIMSDFIHSLTRGFFPQASRSFKSPCASCDFEDNCRLPRHQRLHDLNSPLYQDITWSPIHEI